VPDTEKIHAAVVIPAAGRGLRMGLPIPKQFLELRGVPILIRTISCFLAIEEIRPVVVALPNQHLETAKKLLEGFFSENQLKNILLAAGGATRQDSVQAGLQVLPPETDMVIVHDGARPFVSRDIIHRCLHEAAGSGAALAAIRVRDTIKHVGTNRTVNKTVDRQHLWQAQTPQAAKRGLLEKAYTVARETGFQGTDEASLLEHAGYPVSVVEGSEFNIKITRQEDLLIAERILENNNGMKIGHGFDAHRFGHGRQLVLGGVHIPFDLGLEGHSDADVLTHALIDSLLGAMGAGDIGGHFPDRDQQYKNISSLKLLREVRGKMEAAGLTIVNADLTVICQRPRLAPYIREMRENIAAACRVEPESINIKATTTEMMGFTGRGEGIAAHAVVLLQSGHGKATPQKAHGNAD